MSDFSELLTKTLDGLVSLSPEQIAELEAHYRLLERWNQRMNLSSIRRLDEAVLRHYVECVYFAKVLGDFASELGLHTPSIADVGSGAGFPGIPVAIMHPDWRITLIESHQRKAVFLREAARALPNTTVVNQRAEAVGLKFDLVIARAVDPTEVLSLPLAQRFGLLIGSDDVPRGTEARVVKLPWAEKRVVLLLPG